MEKNIILFKVVKELNIGIATAVDILEQAGFKVENKPTTKLSFEAYQYLLNHYGQTSKINAYNNEEPEITSFKVLENHRRLKGIPSSVFKFLSPNEYGFTSVEEKYLYHSAYSFFNDPFDCNLSLIDFRKGTKDDSGTRLQFQNKLNHAGICCFTTIKDSILMWSHYADNHKGFCLEFRSNSRASGINPLNVVYKNKFKKANYHKDKDNAISHLIYSKAECWSYENELRSLITDIKQEKDRFKSFHQEDLLSIYLGARCSEATEKRIKLILKDVYGNTANLYKARLSPDAFEMIWDNIK